MNEVCDLSSSKAALPVQKYVEEYSIIKLLFLLRKDRYCFLFPAHPIHSRFLSLIKQYFYGLYPKIFNSEIYNLIFCPRQWVLTHGHTGHLAGWGMLI